MSVDEQRVDGSWGPACPLPFWVGFRLRLAECECGQRFAKHRPWVLGGTTALERYRHHWYADHAAPLGGNQ